MGITKSAARPDQTMPPLHEGSTQAEVSTEVEIPTKVEGPMGDAITALEQLDRAMARLATSLKPTTLPS